jgi:hypothetical protein
MMPIAQRKFPIILADELDGLQKITVQNLRLRVQPKMFCNAWKQYGDYPQVQLPDQRIELALGDLVSGEERYVVLMLEVLPLPLLPDGSLPASLEGEKLANLEFAHTSIREEGADLRLESRTSSHLVRIQGTQNPADVVQNVELIAVIANQQAADAVRKAAEALAGGADAATALEHLSKAKVVLEASRHRSSRPRRPHCSMSKSKRSGPTKWTPAPVKACCTKRVTTGRLAAPGCTPALVRNLNLPKSRPLRNN